MPISSSIARRPRLFSNAIWTAVSAVRSWVSNCAIACSVLSFSATVRGHSTACPVRVLTVFWTSSTPVAGLVLQLTKTNDSAAARRTERGAQVIIVLGRGLRGVRVPWARWMAVLDLHAGAFSWAPSQGSAYSSFCPSACPFSLAAPHLLRTSRNCCRSSGQAWPPDSRPRQHSDWPGRTGTTLMVAQFERSRLSRG